MAEEQEASPISYEDLAQIEHEFDDIDTEICEVRLYSPLINR